MTTAAFVRDVRNSYRLTEWVRTCSRHLSCYNPGSCGTASMYSIEFNDYIKPFVCDHCGEQSVTVWGWVAKDNTAHAVYYAGLMTGHADISVRLTLSIGGWGEPDNSSVRRWCFIEVRPTADSCEMMVCEPEESQYFGKPLLGTAMSRAETLSSTLRDEFFAVVDFIVFNDPAIRSYLVGEEVSSFGRKGFAPLARG